MDLQAIVNKVRQCFSRSQPSRDFNYSHSEIDLDDITTYRSAKDIFASNRFTVEERRREYRRRGKSPSGVIDGVYNDMYLEDGAYFNDMDRDWDADA